MKSLGTGTVEATCSSMLNRLNYFSCWYRAKRAIANCTNLKNRLKCPISDPSSSDRRAKNVVNINVEDIQKAELQIIRMVKIGNLPEIKTLRSL